VSQAVEGPKRVLIVCELDGYANGQKPVEIERFLRSRGHDVRMANALLLGRASDKPGSLLRKLPALGLRRFVLYLVQLASLLFTRRWKFGRRHFSYYLVRAELRLRRSILSSSLPLDEFDLIIGEHPNESELMTAPTSARVLYDCPTPWADELYFEGRFTDRQHQKFRQHEAKILDSVDYLSFHWETYAAYAVIHYGISGRNLMQLNWGCTPASQRAEFSNPPRVIYLGSLSTYARFIDLPLLSRLTKVYPHIDVYGGPPPKPSLGLNYLGYAPPSVLRQYQLGLITCSTDELRREGFSAKNLAYIAHGLPVLVPAWRRHMELLRGCVAYDEDTFLSVIEMLSDEGEWRRVSDEAYAQAQELTWERTLQPLEDALRDPSYRYLTPYMQAVMDDRSEGATAPSRPGWQ
jgi:glycosyltransferase involved in cell wall biosynthesis